MSKKVIKLTKNQLELGLKFKKIINDIMVDRDEYELCDIEESIYEYELDGKLYGLKDESDDGWDDEGKYSHRYCVSEITEDGNPTGIYLGQSQSKSGSYYSEYNYSYEKCELVEKYEKVIKVVGYQTIKVN